MKHSHTAPSPADVGRLAPTSSVLRESKTVAIENNKLAINS